jgi:hypothetical protein
MIPPHLKIFIYATGDEEISICLPSGNNGLLSVQVRGFQQFLRIYCSQIIVCVIEIMPLSTMQRVFTFERYFTKQSYEAVK